MGLKQFAQLGNENCNYKNKILWGVLQRTNATTNECYNERML